MINTVENSRAKKTRGIAVTYRAGGGLQRVRTVAH